jgi:hypothetical protein
LQKIQKFDFRHYDDEELRIKKKDIKEPPVPIDQEKMK